jgi:hypothetical protein
MLRQVAAKRFVFVTLFFGVTLLNVVIRFAGAAPVMAFCSLDSVVSEADSIALAVVGASMQTADGFVVALQVVDTLKGSLPASSLAGRSRSARPLSGSITAWYPAERFPNDVAGRAGKTVVAFLAAPRDSGVRPLIALTQGAPPTRYAVVVPPGNSAVSVPQRTTDDTALTKVIKEFARAAATSPQSEAWAYLLNLAWSRDVDPSVPVSLREAFLAMTTSSEPWLAERGVHGLLAQGDIDGLRAFQDALLRRPRDMQEPGWGNVLDSYRSESLEGTAILESMISLNSPSELRRVAGRALGRVHSFAMLPLLARMLDDPDIDLRSSAVQGFSAFAAGFRLTGPQRKEGEWPFLTVDAMTWRSMTRLCSGSGKRNIWRSGGSGGRATRR